MPRQPQLMADDVDDAAGVGETDRVLAVTLDENRQLKQQVRTLERVLHAAMKLMQPYG